MSELSEALEKLDIKLDTIHLGLRSTKETVEKEWWFDEWLVKLELGDKVLVPEGTYKTGLGHRKIDSRRVKCEGGEKYWIDGAGGRMIYGLHNLAKTNYSKPVPPLLEDILHSYLLNASNTDETFENWCANLGYDTDSRKALETYLTCQKIRDGLIRFLGHELFAKLSGLEH